MSSQEGNCSNEKEMVASSPRLAKNDKHSRHEEKIQPNEDKNQTPVETTQTKALVDHDIDNNRPTAEENSTKQNETSCSKEAQNEEPSHVTTSSNAEKQQDAALLSNTVNNIDIPVGTKQLLLEERATVIPADNIIAGATFKMVKNPYLSSVKKPKVVQHDTTATTMNSALEETMKTQHSAVARMPEKHQTPNINIMNTGQKKSRSLPRPTRMSLKVEGYAFHDDIIGVAHLKHNGEEAFNLTLRNMIYNRELEDEGFSSYVLL